MLCDEGGGISIFWFDSDLMIGGEEIAADEVFCGDGYPLLDVLDAGKVSWIALYVTIDFSKVSYKAERVLVRLLDK